MCESENESWSDQHINIESNNHMHNPAHNIKKKDLTTDEKQWLVQTLMRATNEKLDIPYRVVTKVSKELGIHRTNVNRFWNYAKGNCFKIA